MAIGEQVTVPDSALAELASVFHADNTFEAILASQEDALLIACRLVAKTQGIDLQASFIPRHVKTLHDYLTQLGNKNQFNIRRVNLTEDTWWQADAGPLLAFDKTSGEPIALIPQKSGRYQATYAKSGESIIVDKQMAANIISKAYMFYRSLPNKILTWRDIFSFVFPIVKKDVIRIMLLQLVISALALLTPIVIGAVVDNVIPNSDHFLLLTFIIALSVNVFVLTLFNISQVIATIRVRLLSNAHLQAAIWDRLLRLPLGFFKQFTAGDLATRAGGIDDIQRELTASAIISLVSGLFSVVLLALMAYYDIILTLIVTLIALLIVFITILVNVVQVKYQREYLHQHGKLTGLIQQLITGMTKLRTSNSEARAFGLWSHLYAKKTQAYQSSKILGIRLNIFGLLLNVIITMVIYGLVVLRGDAFSFGSFITFNAAFIQFFVALLAMTNMITSLIRILPLYERVKPLLETLPEDREQGRDIGELSGRIEVNHVNFRYSPSSPVIFKDISFSVKAGEFVAIVGPSGSGKTSLYRLLLGFEEPESGMVLYDDCDLANLNHASVRRQLGVVIQDSALTPGTVLQHIVGQHTHVSEDDVWQVLETVALREDIEAMPMGLQTLLAEGGKTLSVGQRQRLSMAKALIHQPKIVFLDEATSALDNVTQTSVYKNIAKLNITRIVAAHRLSTIQAADNIIVINDGHIVQQGTFDALAQQQGLFATMLERQTF